MNILIDSSVWIDYFRGGQRSEELNLLIEQNLICTNDLILAELIPSLLARNHLKVVHLLSSIRNIPLRINWDEIIAYQTNCIKSGINKVGIPDLIILDNLIQKNLVLFTLDKHFDLIQNIIPFKLLHK